MSGEPQEIAAKLEVIAEELTDLSLQRLKESIDAGGTELPLDEKRFSRARRSVEKAIAILKQGDDGSTDD